MLKTGVVLENRYRVLRQIGKGGMSKVFLVEDIYTGVRKAVKESKIGKGESGNYHAQSIRHPGLLEVESIKNCGDSALILMEYVDGQSLQEILIKRGAQPYSILLDWMLQLCDILTYLHTRTPPIIYRDIKPSNIILQQDGRLKLIDFGAAREYRAGNSEDTVLLGTKGYAAPEQYGGCGQTDARTDIYGLGATIYHLATNRDPLKPSFMNHPIIHFVPDIPKIFSNIVQKCTHFEPQKRYESCSEIKSDLLCLKGRALLPKKRTESKFNSQAIYGNYNIETDITVVFTSTVF